MVNRRSLEGGVPEDIYRAQVDAMYCDFRSLWIGAFAASLMTLCVSFESAKLEFAIIAFGLTMVGLLRCFVMSIYNRPATVVRGADALRRWEISYVAGAALHVGLLGASCIMAFANGDSFARVTTLTVTAFFLIGIPGRNFASNLLANVLLLIAGLLIFTALSLGGGYYWFLGFLVVLPSFLTMRKISFRLRGVYLDALLKARDVSVLADRFDTALNNMPHGLAMLGNDGRVVVTNQRLLDLLKLQPSFSDTKTTIEELLHHSAEAGGVCKDEISEVVRWIAFEDRRRSLRRTASADDKWPHAGFDVTTHVQRRRRCSVRGRDGTKDYATAHQRIGSVRFVDRPAQQDGIPRTRGRHIEFGVEFVLRDDVHRSGSVQTGE